MRWNILNRMALCLWPLSLALVGPLTPAAVVGPAPGTVVDGTGPATVWEVNPAGVGHISLVPYFTVRSGFDTYFSVVNTDTRHGKAVKVQFRSGAEGAPQTSITLLLAPGDRWAAAVTLPRAGAGAARMVMSSDRSCLLPSRLLRYLELVAPFYSPFTTIEMPLEGPLEGSVEIITTADIPPVGDDGLPSPLFAAIQAPSAGAEPTCADTVLTPLLVDSLSYADARAKGLQVPTTGVAVQWTLIQVPRAVSYAGRAMALEARQTAGGAPGYGNVVLFPQRGRRAYWDLEPRQAAKYSVVGTYLLTEVLPDLSTPYLPSGLANTLTLGTAPRLQAFAINRALAADSLAGEFTTEASVLAKTDWVLTLPTRYLQVGYRQDLGTGRWSVRVADLTVDSDGVPIGRGVRNFFQEGVNIAPDPVEPSCVTGVELTTATVPQPTRRFVEPTFRDAQGWPIVPAPELQSGSASPFALCGSSVVLRFAESSAAGVLGDARNRRTLLLPSDSGWGRIALPGIGGLGLPVIGFAATELFNSAVAPGFAGAFGLTFPLVTTRPTGL